MKTTVPAKSTVTRLSEHPRDAIVAKAQAKLSNLMVDFITSLDLTDGEIVQLLSAELSLLSRALIESERLPEEPDVNEPEDDDGSEEAEDDEEDDEDGDGDDEVEEEPEPTPVKKRK